MSKKTNVRTDEQKLINKISTSARKQAILLRLNRLAHNRRYTMIQQAELCCMARTTLHETLTGKRELSLDFIEKFAEIHNTDVNVLLFGQNGNQYYKVVQYSDQVSEDMGEYDIIDNICDNMRVLLKGFKYKQLNPNYFPFENNKTESQSESYPPNSPQNNPDN